ncbi:MAG: TIGR03905 family TSCPD domain-containing protein [Victivallales bacterium]|nr:TIGR03905 family TSCPD domain-containing protein [Victivallales bacterium]
MKNIHYNCVGTCSECIDIVLDDEDRVVSAVFTGGCNGNLQGIAKLVRGMPRQEVIDRLSGISCNGGPTSCPDQLARALSQPSRRM